MNSFFGIGPLELIFILIFALIFLGPERLPGAVRQIANIIRQIQNLSSTLSQQLGDEFGDIRELDPRYQIQQILEEPDEKEEAKKAEEKKKADAKEAAKKAEEKKKADEKKKAEEAAKKAAEIEAKKDDESADTTTNKEITEAPTVTEAPDPVSPMETPEIEAADATTTTATAATTTAFVDEEDQAAHSEAAPHPDPDEAAKKRVEARAAASALIPKKSENPSENSIGSPAHRPDAAMNGDAAAKSEVAVNGNGDDCAGPNETTQGTVDEEEQA